MSHMTKDIKLRGFSVFLIAFYISYATYLISHYSFAQGLFFAFSLVAMLGLGIACLFELAPLAICSVAVALPHLMIWILDSIWFSFFQGSFFGIADGRFQPGLTRMEFFLSYYPLILLPVGFYIIKKLPRINYPPWKLGAFIATLGLLFSRFGLLGAADPNCAKFACLGVLDQIPSQYYPWAFLILYTLFSLVCTKFLTLYSNANNPKAPFSRYPQLVVAIYFIFTVALIASEQHRFNQIPRLQCNKLPAVSSVETQCRYTLDYSPGFFSLFFSAHNLSPVAKHCNFYLLRKNTKETMYAAVLIKSGQELNSSVILPYPLNPEEANISVTSDCVSAE